MTEEVSRLRFETESNIEETANAFDRFHDMVKGSISTLGEFETEVTDLGSAMELAMERPRRPMRDLTALWRVSFDQMKRGGQDAAVGASTAAMALRDMSQQIPGLGRLAPVLEQASGAARTIGRVMGWVRERTHRLDADMTRVMRLTSDLGETLRVQSRTMQSMFTEESARMRQSVSALERYVNAKRRIVAQEAVGKEATDAQLITVQKYERTLRNLGIEVKGLEDGQKRLTKAQRDYNLAVRVQGPLMKSAASHLMTARTALRHLATGWEANGKIAKQRLEDVTRSARLYEQEILRMGKAGVRIPAEMARSLEDLRRAVDLWKAKAKEQDGQQEKVNKSLARGKKLTIEYRQAVSSTAKIGAKFTQVNRQIGISSQVLTQSISRISPGLSSVIMTVNQFGGQFKQQMDVVVNSAEGMANRVNASMLLVKGGLIGLGIAAIGVIKKTGLLAAEVKTADVTMRVIARNLAAQTGADMLKFAEYATHVRDSLAGITTREATKAVTTFLRADLPIARLNELSEAAKNYGVTVADMSSSEVLGRFIDFISTGNTALMKKIGIIKTADQMYNDYAKTMGIVREEMTAGQKQMALFEGTLGQVALSAGVYEEAMKTAGKQISSMKRLVEEALLTIGERFEPLIAKIAFGFNKILKWFNELPPSVHDNIANIIKFVAVAGTLTGILSVAAPILKKLIPLIRMLGLSFKAAVPQLLLVALVIKGIMIIISAMRRAWNENIGGIRDTIMEFVDTIKTTLGPVIESVRYWISAIGREIRNVAELLSVMFSKAISTAGPLVSFLENSLAPAIQLLSDIVNGFGKSVWKVLRGFIALLRGDTTAAVNYFKGALVDLATVIALTFKNLIAKAATWGWNLIVQVANGIQEAATSILAKVMTFIGNLIGGFFAPGSPPKEGPLRNIAKWGKGLMDTFLKAFELADFGILRDIAGMIGQALQSAVQAGDITEKQMAGTLKKVRTHVAQLLAEFRKTGEINEEVIKKISDTLGEGGKEYVKYIRLTLEYQKAVDRLKKIQEEVSEAERAGFVSKDLKDRLRAAQDDVENKKEAVDWQREYINTLKESSDLQQQMADKMAKAMGGVADKVGAVADELKKLVIPDFGKDDGKAPFDFAERLNFGKVSEEFLEMRAKVEAFIENVQKFFELPWDQKIAKIQTWLAEAMTWFETVTGLDIGGIMEQVSAIPEKTIEWLEKITGWDIGTWLDTLQTKIGDTWQWIVDKTQWLYDELIGESLIPDTVQGINDEFAKISVIETVQKAFQGLIDFFSGLKEKGLGAIEKITNFFTEVGKAAKALGVVAGLAGFITLIVKFGAIVGTVLGAISGIAGVIGGFVANVGAWVALLGSIAAPFVAIGAAIAALIYGIVSNKDQILGFWQDFKSEVLEMWNEVKPALDEIWTTIEPVVKWIGYIAGGLIGGAIALIVSAVQSLWDVIKVALPYIKRIFHGVFSVIYGIIKVTVLPIFNLLVAAILALTGRSDEAKKRLLAAWNNIKEGIRLILGGLWEIIHNIFSGVIEIVIQFFLNLIKHVGEWVIKVLTKFGVLKEDALATWQEMWDGIIEGVSKFFDNIIQWVTDVYDKIVGKSIFTDLRDLAVEIWQKMWDGIIAGVTQFFTNIVQWVTDVYNDLVGTGSIFSDIKDGAIRIWQEMWSGIIEDVVDFITVKLPDEWTKLTSWIEEKLEEFKTMGNRIIENLVAGVQEKIEWAKTELAKLWGKIRDALPGSEPEDRTSPLYGLGDAGEAIMRNIVEGMDARGLDRLINTQLGGLAMKLQSVPTGSTKTMNFYEGAMQLSFPGVIRPDDAQGIGTILQEQIDRAGSLGHFVRR